MVRKAWPKVVRLSLPAGGSVYRVDCRFTNAEGKRIGRRLLIVKREVALAAAETEALKRENSGIQSLGLGGSQQQEALRAISLLKKNGIELGLEEVARAYIRHVAKTEAPMTLAKLLEKFLEFKKAAPIRKISKRHLADLDQRLSVFVHGREAAFNKEGKLIKERVEGIGADRLAHEIGSREIEQWLLNLRFGRTTRRQYRTHLSNLFNYALQIGSVGDNPIDRVVAMKPEEPPREILTLAQVKALLQAVWDLPALAGIVLGLFAGLRPESEICRLRWKDIHLDRETITTPSGGTEESFGYIDIRSSKVNESQRLVKISPNLYEWLIDLRPENTDQLICPSYDHLNERTKSAALSAKISPWPHDVLRHSFCSYHFAAYRNESLTMAQSGHRNVGIFRKHYCRPIQQKLGYEFWTIVPRSIKSNAIFPWPIQRVKAEQDLPKLR